MTKDMEQLILEQLFKLSDKIEKMQSDMKNFATKDDLKNFATKDDLIMLEKRLDEKFATKDDLIMLEKRLDEKFDQKLDQKLKQQTEEIAEVFLDFAKSADKINKELEERIDGKIQNLRNEFIIYQNTKSAIS